MGRILRVVPNPHHPWVSAPLKASLPEDARTGSKRSTGSTTRTPTLLRQGGGSAFQGQRTGAAKSPFDSKSSSVSIADISG